MVIYNLLLCVCVCVVAIRMIDATCSLDHTRTNMHSLTLSINLFIYLSLYCIYIDLFINLSNYLPFYLCRQCSLEQRRCVVTYQYKNPYAPEKNMTYILNAIESLQSVCALRNRYRYRYIQLYACNIDMHECMIDKYVNMLLYDVCPKDILLVGLQKTFP